MLSEIAVPDIPEDHTAGTVHQKDLRPLTGGSRMRVTGSRLRCTGTATQEPENGTEI